MGISARISWSRITFCIAATPSPLLPSAMQKGGCVYILASKGKRLYPGVTSQLQLRVHPHKTKRHPASFTAKYNIDQLVYYKYFETIGEAIARESQIKKHAPRHQIQLIVFNNPTWSDLTATWGTPTPDFDESKLTPAITFSP